MIHPSYVDLMNVVNKDVEEGETPIINSRYSIVMATAKRARQIVDGDEPMVDVPATNKPLSTAIEEMMEAQLQILPQDEEEIFKGEMAELNKSRRLEYEIGRGLNPDDINGVDEGEDEIVDENEESEEDDEEIVSDDIDLDEI